MRSLHWDVGYSPLRRRFRWRKAISAARFHGFSKTTSERTKRCAETVRAIAERRGATPSQVALAWVLRAGPNVFAIVGTRSSAHLEENLGAHNVRLTSEEIDELDRTFAPDAVGGERYAQGSIFGPNS